MSQRFIARFCAAAFLVVATMGATLPEIPVSHWRVVLVAGDNAQPVFNNAVRSVDMWLTEHGVAQSDIHRLAANAGPHNQAVAPATLERVVGQIAALQSRAGDGCFVFITSHGAHGLGIYLSRHDEMLQPPALARALDAGCGTVPTVVVVSGCYSGSFARGAMRAPNRIVLTAARDDRPSFGCSAEQTYTDYDSCLLGALPHATSWRAVYDETKECVELREHQLDELPSHPQAWFGAAVRDLPLKF
jgi:hypothetical protein